MIGIGMQMYDFTVVLDSEARIVEYEDRASLLGYEKEEVLGKNWFDLFISDPDLPKVKKVFNELFDSGDIIELSSYRNDVRRKDGTHVFMDFDNHMFFDGKGRLLVEANANEHFRALD